jgi:hypothetical protein
MNKTVTRLLVSVCAMCAAALAADSLQAGQGASPRSAVQAATSASAATAHSAPSLAGRAQQRLPGTDPGGVVGMESHRHGDAASSNSHRPGGNDPSADNENTNGDDQNTNGDNENENGDNENTNQDNGNPNHPDQGNNNGEDHRAPSAGTLSTCMVNLVASPDAPEGAEGIAKTRMLTLDPPANSWQDFMVAVEGLTPASSYDVWVDGTMVGSILTDANGEGRLLLSSTNEPNAEPLPPELDPVSGISMVQVMDGSTVILSGDFANARCVQRDVEHVRLQAILLDADGAFMGVAEATYTPGLQDLIIAVNGLPPTTDITFTVDGTDILTAQSNAQGSLGAHFSTHPGGPILPLPDALQPVSGLLSVQVSSAGPTVLAVGAFQIVSP